MRRPLAAEGGCAALCSASPRCQGYTYRARGNESHRNHRKCFLVRTLGPRSRLGAASRLMPRNEPFDSAVCLNRTSAANERSLMAAGLVSTTISDSVA